MSENILKKIIDNKSIKINKLKKKINPEILQEKISEINNFYDFKKKIVSNFNQKKYQLYLKLKKQVPRLV